MTNRRSAGSRVDYREFGGVSRVYVTTDRDCIAYLGVEAGAGKDDYTRLFGNGKTRASSGTTVTIVARPSGSNIVRARPRGGETGREAPLRISFSSSYDAVTSTGRLVVQQGQDQAY